MGRTFLLRIHRLDSRYLCKVTHSFSVILLHILNVVHLSVCICLSHRPWHYPSLFPLFSASLFRSSLAVRSEGISLPYCHSSRAEHIWMQGVVWQRDQIYWRGTQRNRQTEQLRECNGTWREKKAVRKWRDCMKFDMSNDRCADARDGIWTKGFIDLLHSDLF